MNGRRARAQRRAAAPTTRAAVPDRDAIADAVHAAVRMVTGSSGIQHCVLYAETTVRVMRRLTGQPWLLQAGSAFYGSGVDVDSPEGEITFAHDSQATAGGVTLDGAKSERGGLKDREFHAWAARASAPGMHGRAVEIADIAARHTPAYAEMLGMRWERERWPYVWGTPAELASMRVSHRADMPTTALCMAAIQSEPEPYRDAETAALGALGAISPPEAARRLSARRKLVQVDYAAWSCCLDDSTVVLGAFRDMSDTEIANRVRMALAAESPTGLPWHEVAADLLSIDPDVVESLGAAAISSEHGMAVTEIHRDVTSAGHAR